MSRLTTLKRIAEGGCIRTADRILNMRTGAVIIPRGAQKIFDDDQVLIGGDGFLWLTAVGWHYVENTVEVSAPATIKRVLRVIAANPQGVMVNNTFRDRRMQPLGPQRASLEAMGRQGYLHLMPDGSVRLTTLGRSKVEPMMTVKVFADEWSIIDAYRNRPDGGDRKIGADAGGNYDPAIALRRLPSFE